MDTQPAATPIDPFVAWWEKYRPTGTPTLNAGPMVGDDPKLLCWSNPQDWQQVKDADAKNPATVWTLVECDGLQYIAAGLHYVNRLGYFITELPAEPDLGDVPLDDEDDLDELSVQMANYLRTDRQ